MNVEINEDLFEDVSTKLDAEEDSIEIIEKLFENCGHQRLWGLIESNRLTVSTALCFCLTLNHPELISILMKKLFPPVSIFANIPNANLRKFNHFIIRKFKIFALCKIILMIQCTWFLEAYLLGTEQINQDCLALLKKLINSILSAWCNKKDKTSVCSFVAERSFVTELVLISRRLKSVVSKSSQIIQLHSELLSLDRSISQVVFVPISSLSDHVVVRIPYKDASVLNSKDKFILEKHTKSLRYIKENNTCNVTPSDTESVDQISKTCTSEDLSGSTWSKVCTSDIRNKIESNTTYSQRSVTFIDSNDPSANILSEPWKHKVQRIKSSSPFGKIPGWNLYSIIVKYGDDLRQDYLAYQFLKKCRDIWKSENISVWVRPYCVVITESQAGIIEAITDAVSIHQIKSRTGYNLEEYFRNEYGNNSESYSLAKKEFIRSLAGYSLFQYIFQVKDRHNGNILLDLEGHIIHIDFGFILGQSPKNISFESSPFKMSYDFLEVMEGSRSDFFLYFKSLMYLGFMALRKHMDELMMLVDIMKIGDKLSCLGKKGQAVESLKNRFHMDLKDDQVKILMEKLISQSVNSITTFIYDKFQYYTNGIRI
ncbi:hypothetical protein HZS_3521 [Henneguya salminicola]|nr:hypothetical protein HZS_3521 [Henneguya salminicola]